MKSNTGSAYATTLLSDAIDNLTEMVSTANIKEPTALLHLSHALADLDDALTFIPYGDSEVPEAVLKRLTGPRVHNVTFGNIQPSEAITNAPEPIQQNAYPPVIDIRPPEHKSYKVPTFVDPEHQPFDMNKEHELVRDINQKYDDTLYDFVPEEEQAMMSFNEENEAIQEMSDEHISETLLDNSQPETPLPEYSTYSPAVDTLDVLEEDGGGFQFDDEETEEDETSDIGFPMESSTIDFSAQEKESAEQPNIDEETAFNPLDFFSEEDLDKAEAMWGVSEAEAEQFAAENGFISSPASNHPSPSATEDEKIVEGIFEQTDDQE